MQAMFRSQEKMEMYYMNDYEIVKKNLKIEDNVHTGNLYIFNKSELDLGMYLGNILICLFTCSFTCCPAGPKNFTM